MAPAEFGTTPHLNIRKLATSSPLSWALHSSSPVSNSPHSSPHTPPLHPHPLQGMGIPRSPATYSLNTLSPAAHSPNGSASVHTLSVIASASPHGMNGGSFLDLDGPGGVHEAPAVLQHEVYISSLLIGYYLLFFNL